MAEIFGNDEDEDFRASVKRMDDDGYNPGIGTISSEIKIFQIFINLKKKDFTAPRLKIIVKNKK